MSRAALSCGAVVAVLASICACQTVDTGRVPHGYWKLAHSRWPIESFDSYDPYPAGYEGQISAYVDFGQGDGLLRYSLGCGVSAVPYQTYKDGSLRIESGIQVLEPEREGLGCDPELISVEKQFSDFMQSNPVMGGFADGGLPLRAKGKTLILGSVEGVLE